MQTADNRPMTLPLASPGLADALPPGVGTGWVERALRTRPAGGAPVYIETDDPLAVARAVALTPGQPGGQQTWIVAASSDPAFSATAGDVPGRVTVVAGPDAGERLAALLDARSGCLLAGACIVQPGLPHRVRAGGVAGIQAVVQAALERQHARLNHLHQRNVATYAGRTAGWWADRFDRALAPGSTDPLRVLIVTTRYSTFVRHSSEDLGRALRAAGCRVQVLIEPDDHGTLTSVAYADAIGSHQPDLLVAINYARPHLNAAVQLPLPVLGWVQDALSHLFDARSGAAMGPLDFLAGHMHHALFKQCGYPASRALHAPVPVCAATFHDAPVSECAQRGRFECDVAYVGHQSEPPQVLRDRFMADGRAAGPGNTIPAIVEAVYPHAVRVAEAPVGESVYPQLQRATIDAVCAVARREPDAGTLNHLMTRITLPLADRAVRHQMLRWAAEIAGARGLRLHLYGRGWERVPALAQFARGEVSHGDDLRACYQLAACHLHASISTNLHQRVLECALAGGVPLVRLKRDDLEGHWLLAQHAALRKGHADAQWLSTRLGWSWCVDYPEALAAVALGQRLGLPSGNGFSYPVAPPMPAEREDSLAMQPESVWLLGDLAEVGFSTAEALAERLDRAMARSTWRAQVQRGIAGRARRTLTWDGAAAQALRFIQRGLRDQT